MEKLIKRSKKVTTIDFNASNYRDYKPSFFDIYKFETEMEAIESNKSIQEAFYIFILQIMQILENMQIKKDFKMGINNYEIINSLLEIINNFENISNSRIPSFVKEFDIPAKEIQQLKKNRIVAEKAGNIFKEKLLMCSKYYSYAFRIHKAIDLFKIPYSFFNEFIYYSKFTYLNIFKLMDQFYGKINLLDSEELINKKEKIFELLERNKKREEIIKETMLEKEKTNKKKEKRNQNKLILLDRYQMIKKMDKIKIENSNNKFKKYLYLFSFNNFSEYYKKNLRDIIIREQEDDKENFSKVKSNNRLLKGYKRNNYFLSQKILNIYITFINNNLKELLKTFELVNYGDDEKEISEEVSSLNINNIISNNAYLEGNSKKKNSLEDTAKTKGEEIDYFYLIQNKSNKDKNLEEKIFGTYDMIEITDIIEDHFIIQRSFSSLTLIKYSLLNVLAITRLINSKIINNLNIIQIISDFCEITKLPVKKYMNIYLNIFKTLYQIQNWALIKKFKIEECLKIISSHFHKANMISKEEKEKFLNDLKINSSEISSISETNDFKDYIQAFGKFFEITEEKFSSTLDVFQNALKIIESIHLGEYQNYVFNFDYESLDYLFRSNKLICKQGKFVPKIPILLYYSTYKILKKYLIDFSNENILYNELYDDILSLLIYFKIPIIEDKWIENSKEQEESTNEIINKKEDINFKSNKNKKNESKNIENYNSIIVEKMKKIDKIDKYISKENINKIKEDSKENKSELKVNVNDLNEILKKIIAILFDLASNIKEKL